MSYQRCSVMSFAKVMSCDAVSYENCNVMCYAEVTSSDVLATRAAGT